MVYLKLEDRVRGAGAGIAANMAAVAIGTETTGSILNPSAQNSLVGIKPTVGTISRTGVIPLSSTQDTPGPMARTVHDAAITFSLLIGEDPEDPVTAGASCLEGIDWTSFLIQERSKVSVSALQELFLNEKHLRNV